MESRDKEVSSFSTYLFTVKKYKVETEEKEVGNFTEGCLLENIQGRIHVRENTTLHLSGKCGTRHNVHCIFTIALGERNE